MPAAARRLTLICLLVPVVAGTLADPAGAVPKNFFGASALNSLSTSEFQRATRGGLKTMRFQFSWPAIEPSAGMHNWAETDSLVANAAQTGTDLVPFVVGTPRWAAGLPDGPPTAEQARPPIYTPQSRAAWSNFLTELALRYGSNGTFWTLRPELPRAPIQSWQIWNEPNLPYYWGGTPSPRDYADLVRLSRGALTAADPSSKLILAGLIPYHSLGGGPTSFEFLRGLFRQAPGIGKAFDAVAIHPYATRPFDVVQYLGHTRALLNSLGARRMPIWATEFGWPTGGSDLSTSPFRSTRAQQAQRVARTYRLMESRRKRLRVQRAYYFSFADLDLSGTGSWVGQMGLFGPGGEPKPAWYAYARVAGGQP